MNIFRNTGRFICLVALLVVAGVQSVLADEVSFTASAPQAVVRGERFRITYTVNTRNVKDFRAPAMDGLSVLSGPSTSTSSSIQVINGTRTQSTTISFTYTVIADEEGEIMLPGATITAEKQNMQSNGLTIKVLPPDQNRQSQNRSQGGQSMQGGQQGRQPSSQAGSVNGDDLFMLATVDHTTVYEQEAILLSFKVYVAPSLSLTSLSNKMPDLKNFHVQEVELPQQKEFQLEHYNGRNYRTLLWSQYVLFPQHSGELEIPSTTFEGVISQPVESDDLIDFFFNAGRYVETKKDLVTRTIRINVNPLPSGKTDAFYGGVGDFSISSSINATDVTANDAVTIRVVLSGTGNLKLVKTPEIKFPKDFDIYDPKVENKYTIKNGRQTGNKVFEYLAIPRYAGQYTIPALDFQYFDTKSGQYKTISTEEYTLNVAKGQGGEQANGSVSYVSKEDLRYVGQDVRFHATDHSLKAQDDMLFGTPLFYICLAVPVLLLILFALFRQKQNFDNANQGKVKVRKAGSVASKRLKNAHKLMKDGRKDQFYDEMMRAIGGYLGDRLSIPVAELSKDNIAGALVSRNVPEDLSKDIIGLLNDCEFARFAPGDDTGRMDRLYDEAVDAIGRIESTLK